MTIRLSYIYNNSINKISYSANVLFLPHLLFCSNHCGMKSYWKMFFWAEASYPHCDKKQHLEQGSQHYYKLWMLITPVHLINNTDMVLRSYVSCGCQTHWPWCQVWLYLPFSPLSYSQNPPPTPKKRSEPFLFARIYIFPSFPSFLIKRIVMKGRAGGSAGMGENLESGGNALHSLMQWNFHKSTIRFEF